MPSSNLYLPQVWEKGHFNKQCFTKWKGSSTHELSLDNVFLGTVSTQMLSLWSVDVTAKQQLVPLKMDTGEEMTAISDLVYLKGSPLKKPTRVV